MSKTLARHISSSSSRRPGRSTALAVAALVAISGVVATVSVTQLATAAQWEERSTPEILNEGAAPTPKASVYSGIVDARTAYAAEVAAAAKAAAEAAEAAAAAAAEAEAARLASPAGAQEIARAMAASQYGWGDDQFQCLVDLWTRESGWRVNALNASSGATGIPQALPGEKMATAGADWQTNPATQIAWGLGYIASSYGTPCSAWNHSESFNWY